MRNRELGRLVVDAGPIVCFSKENIASIAKKLGIAYDKFIQHFEGIECELPGNNTYGVYAMHQLSEDGTPFPVLMLGGNPEDFTRFLQETEPTFAEFLRANARYAEVSNGRYDQDVFDEIVTEYKNLVSVSVP